MNNLEKRIKELEEVITDILDGNSKPDEIKYFTGLSDERCKEISETYYVILLAKV